MPIEATLHEGWLRGDRNWSNYFNLRQGDILLHLWRAGYYLWPSLRSAEEYANIINHRCLVAPEATRFRARAPNSCLCERESWPEGKRQNVQLLDWSSDYCANIAVSSEAVLALQRGKGQCECIQDSRNGQSKPDQLHHVYPRSLSGYGTTASLVVP